MHRTRIKICGITRPIDAAAAAQMGADAIGMVLHADSPRWISMDVAAQIVADLPPLTMAIGLFVDAPVAVIKHAAATLGLSAVQLHGNETPEMVAQLAPLPVLKAIAVDRDTLPDVMERWREAIGSKHLANLCGFLLESRHASNPGQMTGGSGVANDWEYIRAQIAVGTFASLPPLIAAGGLTPETVGAVIGDLRPWAVDVSSGVEFDRGIKSDAKMAAFIAAARQADQHLADRLAVPQR
jgi:phosphoribosylanthranilate isomerase